MSKNKKSSNGVIKIGRDAKSGQFITVENAIRKPSTSIVEKIKNSKLPPILPRKGK